MNMYYVYIAQEQKRISVRIEMLLCNYSHFYRHYY